MSSRKAIKPMIKKKHPKTPTIQVARSSFPISRWCQWGKWSADGSILMNPMGKQIHPPLPLKLND